MVSGVIGNHAPKRSLLCEILPRFRDKCRDFPAHALINRLGTSSENARKRFTLRAHRDGRVRKNVFLKAT